MQKKIPQRQCMGCRERKEKRQMLRVVRCTDGEVRLDFSGKLNGRGAYVCPQKECLVNILDINASNVRKSENEAIQTLYTLTNRPTFGRGVLDDWTDPTQYD